MNDPYKILGVEKSESDEVIKKAYRELAKKYHPDNYDTDNPLSDFAKEKMQEINDAYDAIMKERKNGHRNYSEFKDVRDLLVQNRIEDAEQILDGITESSRNAEWNFLKGTVFYKRGWLQEAYNYFGKACKMDPNNKEYSAAYNEMNRQRSGNFGGYNPDRPVQATGCSCCDMCTGLLCADCCCECMGGDCIRCC